MHLLKANMSSKKLELTHKFCTLNVEVNEKFDWSLSSPIKMRFVIFWVRLSYPNNTTFKLTVICQ